MAYYTSYADLSKQETLFQNTLCANCLLASTGVLSQKLSSFDSHINSRTMSSNYVYSTPQEYKLKEKVMSISGVSFRIVNCGNGKTAFKVKGHALSLLSEKKYLRDANGNDLYRLSEAMISMRDRMFIEDSRSKKQVLNIRKKSVIPFMGTSTILCFHRTNDKQPYLSIKGNLLRKAFSMTEVSSGRQVASVRRQSNIRSVLA